ncbi:NarL family two-component system sensor histidine kinase LiaS [Anoxybacillus voinovskiensis]|uniref:Sensor histidine kinase n=1 Tax=Anoxybacteroides voinovskiense TaxID=230470 RepID=A0A840E2G5_9BACL|nr:sensor histidine kinase [Anoxybacillus voinovskiensis]MBB4075376.1 NarL family two-component system sensor histidine kinase LiaS [Anoxybacillus voinovskiensis]GGJ78807.1 sensor histidine kinase [Anoxybacillus voinovskiensis]
MNRHIVGALLLAFTVSVVSFLSYVLTFPPTEWSALWNETVLGVPFVLFLFMASGGIGVLFGISFDWFWRKQWRAVEHALLQMEQGNIELSRKQTAKELNDVWERIEKLQKHWLEQTKRTQKLATEKVENEEELIERIISEERNRLARELHDSVSQQLFAASMMMSALMETYTGSEQGKKQLKLVEQMIHQSQLEMRALLLHLRPVQLKGKSLQDGMKELLTELEQKVPMEIKWKIEEVTLDRGVEDHLFRILQESVSNTLRHAKANMLEVLLLERDGFVLLRVSDDGVGFDVERTKSGSYGLQHMYERAAEIGGTLKIVSIKNKGTRLEVKVPLV